jgi:hypothetical protein
MFFSELMFNVGSVTGLLTISLAMVITSVTGVVTNIVTVPVPPSTLVTAPVAVRPVVVFVPGRNIENYFVWFAEKIHLSWLILCLNMVILNEIFSCSNSYYALHATIYKNLNL